MSNSLHGLFSRAGCEEMHGTWPRPLWQTRSFSRLRVSEMRNAPGWNGVPCRSVEEEADPRKRARPVDSILYIVFSSAAPLDERGVDGHWILGPPLAPPFGVLHYAN